MPAASPAAVSPTTILRVPSTVMAGSNVKSRGRYRAFSTIDGQHPYRAAVSDGFVNYAARIRRNGELFYFNFSLAKEMGLIGREHPHVLNAELCTAVLRAFSLQIINEYDLQHQIPVSKADLRPHPYMATRYLQSQHPDKRGLHSGDGRSIWNGFFKGKDAIWDVTSRGTGATCLSPATAINKMFYRTGDETVSYGCGRADLLDGIASALMSEIFHLNDIPTERTLAIIAFDDDTSIDIRAGKNLLRPAHFFRLLKQNDLEGLKRAVDYYISRQISNGLWRRHRSPRQKYLAFLDHMTRCFAQAAARFESEYIFCWLDWDGDNVLADGGIIDYGSVRQFGLYHHEYRYDDVERWSTTLAGQKSKARYIVQVFAQLTEYLLTGTKRNLKSFSQHPALRRFDTIFEETKDLALLYRMGFDNRLCHSLVDKHRDDIRAFRRVYAYFEKVKSKRGLHKVSDGITWDAIFCMRDILRELPDRLRATGSGYAAGEFLNILCSRYASARDRLAAPGRRRKIRRFQNLYAKLVRFAAAASQTTAHEMLQQLAARARIINRYERVTGDAILNVAETLINSRRSLDRNERLRMFEDFVEAQILRPEDRAGIYPEPRRTRSNTAKRLLQAMLKSVRDHRDGI